MHNNTIINNSNIQIVVRKVIPYEHKLNFVV